MARLDAASVTDLFVEIRKRVSREAKEMLPQMAHMGDGDGEFVFIPLQVPEHDIQVALRGGLDHALKGVYERALRRVAQRTRLEDVLDVFNAVDYRFSTKPREREKLWQEKFERFEENAEIDDELAMVALHYCYAKGLGTDKDQEKAYRWAMRAHEVGHGAGKHALAHCYAEGLGVGRNKAAADALLRDSAADFLLSKYRLHEERLWQLLSVPAGKKVPLDAKLSLGADERTRLLADLQAAADGGVEAARCGLAYLACYGIKGIIEARPNENLRLLEAEAHHRGSVLAHYYLACISWDGIPGVVTPDPQKLLLQARTAAEAGHAPAQRLLAQAYLYAPGVPRNYAEARQWAELADNQGNTDAPATLAEIYSHGWGVPKDLKKVAEYVERGDAAGNRRAILYRGILSWNGDYYPRDRDKALTFFERAGQLGEADGWLWAGHYYREKYSDALAHDRPAGLYGEQAAYSYAKALNMGNKEAWLELLGFADYAKEANSRIRREEEESAAPPPPKEGLRNTDAPSPGLGAPSLSAVTGRVMPDLLKQDLAALQGTWLAGYRDREGRVVKQLTKRVFGTKERVTRRGSEGELLSDGVNDFALELRGDDRIFRVLKDGDYVFEYKYRIEGDTFIEEASTYTLIWTRQDATGSAAELRRQQETHEAAPPRQDDPSGPGPTGPR